MLFVDYFHSEKTVGRAAVLLLKMYAGAYLWKDRPKPAHHKLESVDFAPFCIKNEDLPRQGKFA